MLEDVVADEEDSGIEEFGMDLVTSTGFSGVVVGGQVNCGTL